MDNIIEFLKKEPIISSQKLFPENIEMWEAASKHIRNTFIKCGNQSLADEFLDHFEPIFHSFCEPLPVPEFDITSDLLADLDKAIKNLVNEMARQRGKLLQDRYLLELDLFLTKYYPPVN